VVVVVVMQVLGLVLVLLVVMTLRQRDSRVERPGTDQRGKGGRGRRAIELLPDDGCCVDSSADRQTR